MSRFRLTWVGKANHREPETQLCRRYLDRIGKFIPIEEHIIKPRQVGDTARIQLQESTRIEESLITGDTLLLCDVRGRALASEELAQLLSRWLEAGVRRMVLVVGGSKGVSPGLRQRADFVLSLSKMTLPHALARVFLLEQVYRALCIRAGHPYHHEG